MTLTGTHHLRNLTPFDPLDPFLPCEYSILIIDDDTDQLMYYQEELRRMGFRVHARNIATEGLNMLHNIYFDLLICDLNMPHLTGHELIARVRRERTIPLGSRLPIIVLSSSDPSFWQSNGKLDADAFCQKRDADDQLFILIRKLLNDR